MRILLVTEDLPVTQLGGAGKHAVSLGCALLAAGHDVEMLGRERAPGVDTNNDFPGPLHTNIDLAGTGWKEHSLGMFNPIRRVHAARRIWNAIRRCGGPWDVVHYHGHNPIVGAIVPSTVNFIHTLHDQGAECIIKVRFRDGIPCTETKATACAGCATASPNALQVLSSSQAVRSLRMNARVAFSRHQAIFVSRFLEERFRHVVGGDNLRTNVIHNFVNAAELRKIVQQDRTSAFINDGRLRILAAGRVDRMKGFSVLLERISDDLLRQLDLVVIGDGPDLAELRRCHEPRGVRFTGWQSQAYVIAATAAADACIVPSVWEEPFGTTTLEALALGRTVYALDRGGTPELRVYERHDGQLRLFDSLDDLVRAIPEVAIVAPASEVDDAADVMRRLPAIEAVYRRGQAVSGLRDRAA